MKTRTFDGGDLRRVLAAMVTDRTVCGRVASQWRNGEGLFDAPWANLVGGWCVDHHRKYGKVLGPELVGVFERWAERTTAGEDTVRAVERFLRALSDEHETGPERSSDYLLDVAGRYFNRVRLRGVIDRATDELDEGKVDEAYNRMAGVGRVELGVGALVKPAEDYEVWTEAFDIKNQEPLVSYPGRLDDFLGSEMCRDRLIAFMGPDKSGKSFFLLDLAYRAVRNRRRVAFFEVGDMSQGGVLRRLARRAARRPLFGGDYSYPISVDRKGNVEFEKRTCDGELSPGEAYKAFRKMCRGRDLFRLSCHPTLTVTVGGITSILRDWEREDWVPDVVAIDYADILAPPYGVRETLDQIDATWKHMRRMSQELHCLVVTATQSSALAYQGKHRLLGKKHFSGRKTKLAEVDGMAGLNVSAEDKKKGITRVNWVVKREGYYNERRSEVVVGCLAVANPAVKAAE